MLSPSTAAVRNRELSLALEEAKKRGDMPEMQRLLSELTALRGQRKVCHFLYGNLDGS